MTTAASAMSDDERAIRGVVAQWLAASSSGDVDTVLSLMSDDVIFMVPGRKPFGKQEFADASAAMKDLKLEATSNIEELQVLGEWAYLRNRLEISLTPPHGTSTHRCGYTLTILRKHADGHWRVARDANLVSAAQAPNGKGAAT
jgi:uncharacterized protein (TIGR02246 family)